MGTTTPVTLAAVGNAEPCYRNLLTAVDYHPGRWSDPTVAAAAALEGAEGMSPSEWTVLLDQIERRLAPIFEEFERHSGVHAIVKSRVN